MNKKQTKNAAVYLHLFCASNMCIKTTTLAGRIYKIISKNSSLDEIILSTTPQKHFRSITVPPATSDKKCCITK